MTLAAMVTIALGVAVSARAGSVPPPAALPPAHRPVPEMAHADSPLDSIFAAYNSPDGPGASVMVIKRGDVIARRQYGLADVEAKQKVTENTNFRLASLSKQFTAMAIMILSEEQKLTLDDPIINHLTTLPEWARPITIRHLLTHTSGIWAYEDFVPDSQTRQVKDQDVLALMQRPDSTHFVPGSAFRYSNTGYALLALIVQKVSGVSYAQYLKDHVFRKSGMLKTVAFEDGVSKVSNRAFGYSERDGKFVKTDQSNTSAVLGDGGIYSSTYDLLWWIRSLQDHVLIHEETQKLAWTPYTLAGGASAGYGFGWFISNDGGELHYWHNGESRGFTNGIVMYPKRKLTVIVLTNRTGGEPWKLAQRVAALKQFQ